MSRFKLLPFLGTLASLRTVASKDVFAKVVADAHAIVRASDKLANESECPVLVDLDLALSGNDESAAQRFLDAHAKEWGAGK